MEMNNKGVEMLFGLSYVLRVVGLISSKQETEFDNEIDGRWNFDESK